MSDNTRVVSRKEWASRLEPHKISGSTVSKRCRDAKIKFEAPGEARDYRTVAVQVFHRKGPESQIPLSICW